MNRQNLIIERFNKKNAKLIKDFNKAVEALFEKELKLQKIITRQSKRYVNKRDIIGINAMLGVIPDKGLQIPVEKLFLYQALRSFKEKKAY